MYCKHRFCQKVTKTLASWGCGAGKEFFLHALAAAVILLGQTARYNCFPNESFANAKTVLITAVIEGLSDCHSASTTPDAESSPNQDLETKKLTDWNSCMDEILGQQSGKQSAEPAERQNGFTAKIIAEVDQYLAEPPFSRECDPLTYWKVSFR